MAYSDLSLGISFGSSFCRAAWINAHHNSTSAVPIPPENQICVPSLFHDGSGGALMGTETISKRDDVHSLPFVCSKITRDLGREAYYHVAGQDYSPVQAAALVLKGIKTKSEKQAGRAFLSISIAYPVWFDAIAEEALREAAACAGWNKVTLLTQAEATAQAFTQMGHKLGKYVLVIDVGATSTDLSVLARESDGTFSVGARSRSLPFGGEDFDRLLYTYISGKAEQQAGHPIFGDSAVDLTVLESCRHVKETLSDKESTVFAPMTANSPADEVYVPIDRDEFERLIRPNVEEIVRIASEFAQAAADRNRSVETVLLTGGSVHIPLVRQLITEGLSACPVLTSTLGADAAIGAALMATGRTLTTNEDGGVQHMDNANNDDKSSDELGSLFQQTKFAAVIEEAKRKPLVFLVVGRTGVGKSSTINSLMERVVADVGHYVPTTFDVTPYSYEHEGVRFTFVDTPGLCDALPEEHNDEFYLKRMQENIKEFHSLWYVTQLNDVRARADEKRAIKLLSEAFVDKAKVWEKAVIIFTHADAKDTKDPYPKNLEMRTEVLREQIAKYAGQELASKIPSVAVDNMSDTTPDGKLWRGELYYKMLTSMSREGVITFFLGTSHLITKQEHPDESSNARSRYDDQDDRPSRRRGYAERETAEEVKKYVTVEVHRTYEEKVGNAFNKVDTFLGTGTFFKGMGQSVGRALDWLFG